MSQWPSQADQLIDLLRDVAQKPKSEALLNPDDCIALVSEIEELKGTSKKVQGDWRRI